MELDGALLTVPSPLEASHGRDINTTTRHPYSSSLSSSASSSSSSVFSVDSILSQSSASSASSSRSLQALLENDNDASYPSSASQCSIARITAATNTTGTESVAASLSASKVAAGVVPSELRKHPRRTQAAAPCAGQVSGACSQVPSARAPPSLVRQSERKVNFVDNLVVSAAQMVETIWPLSDVSCRTGNNLGSKSVLPLRTFIQETLRRSRTSYSTLQVALYYLVLIKSHVPKHDFTMEQPPEDSHSIRALQCGRRMFLAALILASKYLQDRNYSARAWSKISGLNTCEINANELSFLKAVNWRLHISEPVFQRWTDIVLKYTPSAPSASPVAASSPIPLDKNMSNAWRSVIPRLTPELENIEPPAVEVTEPRRIVSPVSLNCSPHLAVESERFNACDMSTTSTLPTPKPLCVPPRVLEPTPRFQPQTLPSLSRMVPLPTPSPSPPYGFPGSTPSVPDMCLRRPSIGSALAMAQNACMARTSLEQWVVPPTSASAAKPFVPEGYVSGRRTSLARSSPPVSSPESMTSDNSSASSSRSSRSSSISSVASSLCAPPSANFLAARATCRNATLKGSARAIRGGSVFEDVLESAECTSSPESYAGSVHSVPDFSNFSLSSGTPYERSVSSRAPPCETVQPSCLMLNQGTESGDGSSVLRGQKRSRGCEEPSLQRHVRKLMASQSLRGDMVVQDRSSTSTPSILLDRSYQSTPTVVGTGVEDGAVVAKATQLPTSFATYRLPLQKDMGRKRACCAEEARVVPDAGSRPSMWNDVL
ncbi:hypothetical protein L228DRAFT_182165 [Xylona heveae TC161]|uniref:G1/S-specific cyclin Pcl5 n=1 Tax=Xylona heveae (strain CBS 132557 / TC161) TaxID=1328760 RepID=A0A165FFR1_XYLHT|nr:hypothetical protein L228DRAFT_182165 [Xylona heveae TC161]KZF20924.1 hypothetical protein L228DRAFT_182165 [Xylona heveae TC161]